MREPLTNEGFRRVWVAAGISSFGDAFNGVALLWVVWKVSGSGLAIGGVLVARLVPPLLLAPLAGSVVDRFARRTVMIAADAVRAVLTLSFLLVTTSGRLPIAFVAAALMASASSFFEPARRASVPVLLKEKSLAGANSLLQIATRVIFVIGSGGGGLAVAAAGPKVGFLVNSASFAASGALLLRTQPWDQIRRFVSAVPAEARDPRDAESSLRETLRVIARSRILVASLVVVVGWALAGGAFHLLLSLFPAQVFTVGPSGIGALYAAYGLGTLLGSSVAASAMSEERTGGVLLKVLVFIGSAYVLNGLAELLVARSPNLLVAGIGMVLVGIWLSIGEIGLLTVQMQLTPDAVRGHFFSLTNGLETGTLAASTLVGGVLVSPVGPRGVGTVAALVHVAVGVAFLLIATRGAQIIYVLRGRNAAAEDVEA